MMESKVSVNKRKYASINVLRGISVWLIVLYHYTFRYSAKEEIQTLGLSVDWNFQLPWGCAAVVTFFMMSGFLIGGYFCDKKMTCKSYLVNRAYRLYPSYWSGVLITYITVLLLFPQAAVSFKALLFNFTMIPYFFHQPCVDGAYWTMQVEFFFSLMIGAILLFGSYKVKRRMLLLWMVICMLLYFIPGDEMVVRGIKLLFTMRFAHLFIAGIVAFQIIKKNYQPEFLIILVICCVIQFLQAESNYHTIFFFLTFAVFIFTNQIDLFLSNRYCKPIVEIFTFFASISYSWYLIHQMIGYSIIKNVVALGWDSEWILLLPVCITILIALALYKLVEKPTAKLGKSLSSRYLNS